jgi:hypothetical protein
LAEGSLIIDRTGVAEFPDAGSCAALVQEFTEDARSV